MSELNSEYFHGSSLRAAGTLSEHTDRCEVWLYSTFRKQLRPNCDEEQTHQHASVFR